MTEEYVAPEPPPDYDVDEPRFRPRVHQPTPPSTHSHNLQAEEALLGIVLTRAGSFIDLPDLLPDDFYGQGHGEIWAAAQALEAEGKGGDLALLSDELKSRGLLEVVGGPTKLLSLTGSEANPWLAKDYAGIIATEARRRRVASIIVRAHAALTEGRDVTHLLDEATEANAHLAERQAATWAEIDVAAVLDGDCDDLLPELLSRDDGLAMIYPGRVHAFNAPPESAKSFLALFCCAQQMESDGHVLYIDFEDHARSVLGRLRSMGVSDEVLKAQFHYVRPDDAIDAAAQVHIRSILASAPIAFCVVDGVAEALTISGLSENDAADVTKFYALLPRLIARQGVAVVLIDHVVKDAEKAGRYARGSGAKLAGIDGATYSLSVVTPFGRGRHGKARIEVTKDRPGHVRASAMWGKVVGEFHLEAEASGNLRAWVAAPEEREEYDGPTDCMTKVLEIMRVESGREMNVNQVFDAMKAAGHGFRKQTVSEALVRLRQEKRLSYRVGPRRADLYSWQAAGQVDAEEMSTVGAEEEEAF